MAIAALLCKKYSSTLFSFSKVRNETAKLTCYSNIILFQNKDFKAHMVYCQHFISASKSNVFFIAVTLAYKII